MAKKKKKDVDISEFQKKEPVKDEEVKEGLASKVLKDVPNTDDAAAMLQEQIDKACHIKKMPMPLDTAPKPGTIVESPKPKVGLKDSLQNAVDLLKPIANDNNPCLQQAYSLLTKHVVHLVETGLGDVR